MNGRPVLVALFVSYVKKWADSVEASRLDEARWYARELGKFGQGLTNHPDFRRAFDRTAAPPASADPDAALASLSGFLSALAEVAQAPAPGARDGTT